VGASAPCKYSHGSGGHGSLCWRRAALALGCESVAGATSQPHVLDRDNFVQAKGEAKFIVGSCPFYRVEKTRARPNGRDRIDVVDQSKDIRQEILFRPIFVRLQYVTTLDGEDVRKRMGFLWKERQAGRQSASRRYAQVAIVLGHSVEGEKRVFASRDKDVQRWEDAHFHSWRVTDVLDNEVEAQPSVSFRCPSQVAGYFDFTGDPWPVGCNERVVGHGSGLFGGSGRVCCGGDLALAGLPESVGRSDEPMGDVDQKKGERGNKPVGSVLQKSIVPVLFALSAVLLFATANSRRFAGPMVLFVGGGWTLAIIWRGLLP
jgi:hypothetical protein